MATWCVKLADATLELTSTSPTAVEQLRRFFGPLPRSRRAPDVEIRVDPNAAVRPRDRPPDTVDGPVRRWGDGAAVELHHDAGVGASVTSHGIAISGTATSAWRPLRQLLSSALAVWFARRGLVLLHGALIERDGDGIVVLGPTGSGKSTVAVGALAAGWRVHADDLVLLTKRSDGELIAHGIPKEMTVDPALVVGLDMTATPIAGDERGRSVLPATILDHGELPVRAVVVVGHADDDGSLARLPDEDRLVAAVSSAFEATRPSGVRDTLAVLAPLGAVAGFRLDLAAASERRVDRVAELLHELDATEPDRPTGRAQ